MLFTYYIVRMLMWKVLQIVAMISTKNYTTLGIVSKFIEDHFNNSINRIKPNFGVLCVFQMLGFIFSYVTFTRRDCYDITDNGRGWRKQSGYLVYSVIWWRREERSVARVIHSVGISYLMFQIFSSVSFEISKGCFESVFQWVAILVVEKNPLGI